MRFRPCKPLPANGVINSIADDNEDNKGAGTWPLCYLSDLFKIQYHSIAHAGTYDLRTDI